MDIASSAAISHATVAAPRDWSLLMDPSRPNGLLVGSSGALEACLRLVDMLLQRPVFHWPADGCPWTTNRTVRTLILHHPNTLRPPDQARLMRWMDDVGCNVQVISLASMDLFPLVQRRVFLGSLYYRLNAIYLQEYR